MSDKQFTASDLISFGNYLVSDARRKTFGNAPKGGVSKSERMKVVHDSDIQNWKEQQSPANV